MNSCSMWNSPLICWMPLIRWTYPLSLWRPPCFHAQLVRHFLRCNCQLRCAYPLMVPLMWIKIRHYAASLLSRARGRSAAILSNMVGGGESHAGFIGQESTSNIVKSRTRRCVLGCKDTVDGPLCVITPEESGWYRTYVSNFLLDEVALFMTKKFWNRFCLHTPVSRIFFIKLNEMISSSIGVGTKLTLRKHCQSSCFFVNCCITWGVVGLTRSTANEPEGFGDQSRRKA
jgi:hypothetical protein